MNRLKQINFWLVILVVFFLKMTYLRYEIYGRIDVEGLFVNDLSIVVLLLLIIRISQKHLEISYIIVNLLVSILLLSIIIYHNYYGSILTFNSIKQINQLGEVKESIFSLFNPKYLFLFIDIFIGIILMPIFKKKKVFRAGTIKKRHLFIISGLVILVFFNNYRINSGIVNEVKKAEKMGIINYQLVDGINELSNRKKVGNQDEIRNELAKIKDSNNLSNNHNYFGYSKDKNLIVVQLESFQNFPIGLAIDGVEITPVLNNLIKDSLYFDNFFQQIGMGNTSDAEFTLNTSIYPLGNIAMSEFFDNIEIPSLPRVLNDNGYETMTFHTNDVNFWNRKSMYNALGFSRYYDKAFFGEEDIIAMGASDEVLYEKAIPVLKELSLKNTKFYANFISMSSHHPFKLPADKIHINLSEDLKGTSVGDYLTAVNYADYALGKLIEELKENKIWDNTIFVVYGDHFGLQLPTKEDENQINAALGRIYDTTIDAFNVPLIIRVPGMNSEKISTVGGQIDILPTIANLLGISLDNFIYFGEDILNAKENLLGMRFYSPTGTFVNNEVFFVPGEYFKDGNAKSLNNFDAVNLDIYEGDYDRILKILELSDRYAQSLKQTYLNKKKSVN